MGRRTAAAFTPIALLGLIAVILAGCAAFGITTQEKATSNRPVQETMEVFAGL